MCGYPKEVFAQMAAAMALQGIITSQPDGDINTAVDRACDLGDKLAERFEQREKDRRAKLRSDTAAELDAALKKPRRKR